MDNKKYYIANKGMVYKRKSDNKIVGKYVRLNKLDDGSDDIIENYEEVVDEKYLKIKENIENQRLKLKELIDKKRIEIKKSIKNSRNNGDKSNRKSKRLEMLSKMIDINKKKEYKQ